MLPEPLNKPTKAIDNISAQEPGGTEHRGRDAAGGGAPAFSSGDEGMVDLSVRDGHRNRRKHHWGHRRCQVEQTHANSQQSAGKVTSIHTDRVDHRHVIYTSTCLCRQPQGTDNQDTPAAI